YASEQPAVAAIQVALVDDGYAGQVNKADWCDGQYGPPTTAAVKALQAAHGLPQTGNVDAATWAVLFPAPAPVQPPAPAPAPAPAVDVAAEVADALDSAAQALTAAAAKLRG
ncbi:MAG TPA: peptidoglycan-binding domain-containing protein, partial [Trebonia sp.]